MIAGSRLKVVVSSLGWADRNALWVYHADSDRIESLRLEHGGWIQVLEGDGEYFATIQASDAGDATISVRRFDAPADALAVAHITGDHGTLEGAADAWKHVPTAYIARSYYLVRCFPEDGRWDRQEMPWFDNATYDMGWQSITGVTRIPGQDVVIVSVQRDSHPVLYDPESKRLLGRLSLGGHQGGSKLRFREKANELWSDAYDTLVRLHPGDWQTTDSLRIQDSVGGMKHPIGEWNFNTDESLCSVARTFSGDVLFVDTATFTICGKCITGGQPLEAVLIDGLGVIARDWKTGRMLKGADPQISLPRRF
jgi:hypothetical protein